MADHDNSYKQLFSHPEMVADLLRGFVREDWVGQLDFSTLEKQGTEHISRRLRKRVSDVVWRLRWKGGEQRSYVYVILELQSTVDPFMPVRAMAYMSLLYQDLVRQKVLTPSGRLPPVLVIVLYNGKARWDAAADVAELVEVVPGGLEKYRPQLRYCLLDQGRIGVSESESLQNLAAALFRMEHSPSLQDFQQMVGVLAEWLNGPEHASLHEAFVTWIERVSLPARLPGIEIPHLGNLQEVKRMLAEGEIDWTREWKQKGLEEGLRKGRREGRQEGRQEGFQEGRQEVLRDVQGVLLRHLEKRFGPLSEQVRRRVEAIGSTEELAELSLRIGTAPSLVALGLDD